MASEEQFVNSRQSQISVDSPLSPGFAVRGIVDGNRDGHTNRIMKSRFKEYTHLKQLRVHLCTWNVNGKPCTENLRDWLQPSLQKGEGGKNADLVAVGFQELDLSNQAYIFSEASRNKETEWVKSCEQGLMDQRQPGSATTDPNDYDLLRVVRLVGIMLAVFVKKKHVDSLSNVCTATVATGIMGILGNKGGVGVRLQIHGTTICFINTHLAAHVEELERRNQDYKDISSRMSFVLPETTFSASIANHDMVFWMGDLNYRVVDLETAHVKELVSDNDLESLLNHDQLNRARSEKRVFTGFKEVDILFPPTYKYDVGSDEFDTSEKMRCPAWTDRVLYKGRNISPNSYISFPSYCLSDHKPVAANYSIGVSVTDGEKYRVVYEQVIRQLDRMENEYLPQVELSDNKICFGDVKFFSVCRDSIIVKNTGQVDADFEFISKLEDSSYSQPWLTIIPCKGSIPKGEELELMFDVFVEVRTANQLNKTPHFEDIVVLHLNEGKDLFISVSGSYIPSSFGRSLHDLVRIAQPLRLATEEQQKLEGKDETADSVDNGSIISGPPKLPIPKELFFLIDYINTHGLQTDGLFQLPGLHSEVSAIVEYLDTHTESTLPGSVHSAAESLLMFLVCLPEPIIPFNHFWACLEASSLSVDECKETLLQIPPIHLKVFEYLKDFVVRLLEHADKNSLTEDVIASVLSSVILRPPPTAGYDKFPSSRKQEINKQRSLFLRRLLLDS